MMLEIDGARGEGSGQTLRTSLSLAMLTGQPVRLKNIRAARPRPGLLAQHLAAVKAAARISQGRVGGDQLYSQELTFEPGPVSSGEYHVDIGTAGSTSLVVQTLLPALMTQVGPSRLVLTGGTHNPWAPPFEFFSRAFLPCLTQMGPEFQIELTRYGFAPAGGGLVSVGIQPVAALRPLVLCERGQLVTLSAAALLARIPTSVGNREMETVRRLLADWNPETAIHEVPSIGPGNAVVLTARFEQVTEVVLVLGEKRLPAETVAERACAELLACFEADVPVSEFLADQLLLPLALAGGGAFETGPLSGHTTTNIETIRLFLDIRIDIEQVRDNRFRITVGKGGNVRAS